MSNDKNENHPKLNPVKPGETVFYFYCGKLIRTVVSGVSPSGRVITTINGDRWRFPSGTLRGSRPGVHPDLGRLLNDNPQLRDRYRRTQLISELRHREFQALSTPTLEAMHELAFAPQDPPEEKQPPTESIEAASSGTGR